MCEREESCSFTLGIVWRNSVQIVYVLSDEREEKEENLFYWQKEGVGIGNVALEEQCFCCRHTGLCVCATEKSSLFTRGKGLCVRERENRSGLLRGGGLGSSTIFKKFNEPYAPS